MLTDEQREMRKKGIGGSDVAAIFGISPYKTPLSVYIEKIGLKEDEPSTPPMDYGNDLEPYILKKYADLEKVPLTTNMPTKKHARHEFLLANIDGLREDGIIVEAKNVGVYGDKGQYNGRKWGQQRTCEVPEAYHLQVAHYCMVMNLDKAHIVPYFGGSDLRVYVYERNERLENIIMQKCISFWNDHVLVRVPPLNHVSSADLNCLWRELDIGTASIADESVEKMIADLHRLRARAKAIKTKDEEIKNRICAFMEDKTQLKSLDGERLASWREEKRSTVDVQSLRIYYPEAVESFTKVNSNRVFRLNGDNNDQQ